jgi:hypothetical protein
MEYLNICYIVAGFWSISADNAISNTEIHQNTVFIKLRDVMLTNDAWTVIVNLDFSPYEQTIAKLRDDLLCMQKFKMPLAPVHELNHIDMYYRNWKKRLMPLEKCYLVLIRDVLY